MIDIDTLAARLREAYAEFSGERKGLVSWNDAAARKQDAWRAIAAKAMELLT